MGGRKGIAPVAFDPHTVARMEQLFEKQKTPTTDMLAELQCQCGDDIVRIRKWFRDRRYRERKIAPPQGVHAGTGNQIHALPPLTAPTTATVRQTPRAAALKKAPAKKKKVSKPVPTIKLTKRQKVIQASKIEPSPFVEPSSPLALQHVLQGIAPPPPTPMLSVAEAMPDALPVPTPLAPPVLAVMSDQQQSTSPPPPPFADWQLGHDLLDAGGGFGNDGVHEWEQNEDAEAQETNGFMPWAAGARH